MGGGLFDEIFPGAGARDCTSVIACIRPGSNDRTVADSAIPAPVNDEMKMIDQQLRDSTESSRCVQWQEENSAEYLLFVV